MNKNDIKIKGKYEMNFIFLAFLGASVTLHETHCFHTSMNVRKNENYLRIEINSLRFHRGIYKVK